MKKGYDKKQFKLSKMSKKNINRHFRVWSKNWRNMNKVLEI